MCICISCIIVELYSLQPSVGAPESSCTSYISLTMSWHGVHFCLQHPVIVRIRMIKQYHQNRRGNKGSAAVCDRKQEGAKCG